MQRFGLRALTIVTLIVLILPAGSLATAAGSVEPFLEPAGAPYRIYLPMSAQAPTVPPAPANMVLVPAGTFRMGWPRLRSCLPAWFHRRKRRLANWERS